MSTLQKQIDDLFDAYDYEKLAYFLSENEYFLEASDTEGILLVLNDKGETVAELEDDCTSLYVLNTWIKSLETPTIKSNKSTKPDLDNFGIKFIKL